MLGEKGYAKPLSVKLTIVKNRLGSPSRPEKPSLTGLTASATARTQWFPMEPAKPQAICQK